MRECGIQHRDRFRDHNQVFRFHGIELVSSPVDDHPVANFDAGDVGPDLHDLSGTGVAGGIGKIGVGVRHVH